MVKKKNAELRNFRKKLPDKYRDINFSKEGTLLGQKISLQKNTTSASNERLKKAKGAWSMIKNRVFLDKEVNTKIKLDLWNAAVNSIMKYSMTTIIKTQAQDENMQKFASKCLRQIVIGKFDNGNEPIISNYNIRKNNNIPTIHSQLMRDKLCDIYRWKTSLSPAYLNNMDECESLISRWTILWERMKQILIKKHNDNNLNDEEKNNYNTFKSLVKKEMWYNASQK